MKVSFRRCLQGAIPILFMLYCRAAGAQLEDILGEEAKTKGSKPPSSAPGPAGEMPKRTVKVAEPSRGPVFVQAPRRGFFIAVDAGATAMVFGDLKGAHYGPSVGVSLGSDVGENLALHFSIQNTMISRYDEVKYNAETTGGGQSEKSAKQTMIKQGDFSLKMISAGAKFFMPTGEKTRFGLKGAAGFALASPTDDKLTSAPVVNIGPGVEYNSNLINFSMGIFVEACVLPTIFEVGVSVLPTVKYTF